MLDEPTKLGHTFVVPAYGDSPYLDACLASLRAQRCPSDQVFVCTSTPSSFIDTAATRHGVPVLCNPNPSSIGGDWNFALAASSSPLVTLAHQDDLFDPGYTEAILRVFSSVPGLAFAFTNYGEFDESGPRAPNVNLKIKRLISRCAAGRNGLVHGRARTRRLLAFGNPVCCPSVVINRAQIGNFRFSMELGSNLDWDAWERILSAGGVARYIDQALVVHRVHGQSETSAAIADTRREVEDLAMFRRFWPEPVAQALMSVYRFSYRANRT